MSAKLLHALSSDETPDLHKQIGCMTGILHIFDRHHILTPKRITSYSSHKRPPTGQLPSNNSNQGEDGNNVHYTAKEKISSKNVTENHRISMESARASFSSSTCSSSFSSVDYNKTAQSETSSYDRSVNSELPSRELSSMPVNASSQSQKSSDFREVVKDSIYKEARSLSVKTTAKEEEPVSRVMKHRDSPRPLQPSRSVDGSAERGVNVRHRSPSDVKESLNALSKLQETPRYFHDTREPARSSYEARERSSFSVQKETPRFSYDGREASRSSFESRDTFKSTAKLRELPRLSLDSRASSMRGSDTEAKSNSFLRDFERGSVNSNRNSSPQQRSETPKQNHSVVAKLMGLETMPKTLPPSEGLTKSSFYAADNHDSLSRSSKASNDSKQNSRSPRTTLQDPLTPQLRNPDPFMKPLSSPRFPIEPAPWKQIDGVHAVQKPVFRNRDSLPMGTNASPSVYAEIEKRLKELEFKQSDRDLRALKQILDTMQAKGLLEKKKEDQGFDDQKQNILDQNPRLARRTNPVSSTNKVTSSPRTYDSPIVIMKPAKYIERSALPASSVIPIDGISSLRRIRSGNSMESKKSLVNNRMSKDSPPKVNLRESVKKPLKSTEKIASTRNVKSPSSLIRSQTSPRENMVSLGRSSGSVSPRLPQRKLDLEKQTRPTTPSSDLSKPRRISLRQATDSGSPGGRRKLKSLNLPKNDDQGDELSVRSDSNVSLASQVDTEVTSADRSGDINNSWSPSRKIVTNMISSLKQKKLSPRLSEEGSLVEFTTIAPEQPSPVSVLDSSFYNDDLPSPERKICGSNLLNNKELTLSTDISRKKLENVEQLVQKLRRLNSNHDEATTDYIGSLCKNTNPDHRYISEILLASGLLLRDLGSGLTTIPLHKSGYLINPDLFSVLEQTKASNGFSNDRKHVIQSKSNQEKVHRRLVFDLVNEILEVKLASNEVYQRANKLAGKTLNGQQLLKELCSEVEQLQTNENSDSGYDDADDFLKDILCKDVMSQTEKWTDLHGENSGIVLDIERLLFKDLIDEIISGEASNLQAKPGRRCRQLFAK